MKILAIKPEQAVRLSAFILPGILERPESKDYWYLAAADEERGLLGVLVLDPRAAGASLESVAVAQGCERQGVASALILDAAERLIAADVPFLMADGLLAPADWTALDGLLRSLGFESEDEPARLYEVSLLQLQALPLFRRYADRRLPRTRPVAALSGTERTALVDFLRTEGGLVFGGLADCDPDCSFLRQTEAGEVESVFLLSPPENGQMYNLWTWLNAESDNPATLVSTVVAAVSAAAARYPAETVLVFSGISASGGRLLDHMLGDYVTGLEQRGYALRLPSSAEYAALKAQAEQEEAYLAAEAERQLAAADEPVELTDDADPALRALHERYMDYKPELMTLADMTCRDCRHRTEGRLSDCARYLEKPGAVYQDGPCPLYEKD